MTDERGRVLDRLRAELVGPANGERETITGRPVWRYLCGMLFPSGVSHDDLVDSDDDDPVTCSEAEDLDDPNISLAYETLPAAMGVTFFMRGGRSVSCAVEAACYERYGRADGGASDGDEGEREDDSETASEPDDIDSQTTGDSAAVAETPAAPTPEVGDLWRRRPLGTAAEPEIVSFDCPRDKVARTLERTALEGRAAVECRFRPHRDGHLVTVTLVNTQEATGGAAKDVESILFQCRLRVRVNEGSISSYPSVTRHSLHPEDEELELTYRARRPYAIGHGCAACWDACEADAGPPEIRGEPLPEFEVRPLTNDIELPPDASKVLNLRWLAHPDVAAEELGTSLGRFVGEYRRWVERQERISAGLDPRFEGAARRLLGRQAEAVRRMEEGVRLLTSGADADVLEAFRFAQEAMLRQFLWSSRRTGPRDLGEGHVETIDPWDEALPGPRWRPFQLAFQLLVIESVANAGSPDRGLVDLLWFPTGGGKTEAYLGIVAFETALRRLRYGLAGGGTTAIMRYTLRLLTTQQFDRAATLISVMEKMRQARSDLGSESIRLGLWVGGATSPNRLDHDVQSNPGAVQLVEELLAAETPENPFHLRTCPHCSTRIVPRRRARKDHYGVSATRSEFRLWCPDERCVLHDGIPVSVVDEDLYQRPPTLLIGTIDKFARLAWTVEPRVFLGRGRESVLPPGLIIQDELHLISGPLGTIAGLYEAAIDAVIHTGGAAPKYLASTATIQRADEQCRALYGREPFVFPPRGLDVEDAFFVREDTSGPGRMFVGGMGHGLYSSLTALVQASTAAARSAEAVPEEEPIARDSFWTQVIYHNSRQELGKTTTMLRDDVRQRLELLSDGRSGWRVFDRVEELSANLKGPEISAVLERLQTRWPDPDVIDAVACTNMISVGVDISRLGLMLVKGQPKSTAEYIQASSRVGRDPERPPGIVLALYSAVRPRDRSHYEMFQSYHQALYRQVEPSTVTPFSPPARQRALHAALIIVLRHAMGWKSADAKKFDPDDPAQRDLIRALGARLQCACRPDEVKELEEDLDALISEWRRVIREDRRPVTFNSGRQYLELLVHFSVDPIARDGIWPTLNSMRHVDGEVAIRVRGETG